MNASDAVVMLSDMAIRDAAHKAPKVAVSERAAIARTIAHRVIYMGEMRSVEADVDAIESAANDVLEARAFVESYRGKDSAWQATFR